MKYIKKLTNLLILLFLLPSTSYSQTLEWVNTMGGVGGDAAADIAIDDSGNVYTTGNFATDIDFDPSPTASTFLICGGRFDAFVQKTDKDGNFVWAKSISGPGWIKGIATTVDQKGNVYTTGYFRERVDFDSGPGTHSVTATEGADAFIQKLDQAGNLVWVKIIEGGPMEFPHSITLDDQGNLYTVGSFEGTVDFDPNVGNQELMAVGGRDIFIQKLDTAGNFIWAKSMGGIYNDEATSLAFDQVGNLYLSGHFQDSVDFDPNSGTSLLVSQEGVNLFILKLDTVGNLIWAKSIEGTEYNRINDTEVDRLGHIYLTGHFGKTADFDPGINTAPLTAIGESDIFILKLDTASNFIWAKSMGGSIDDAGNGISIDASGDLYVMGDFESTVDFDPNAGIANLTSAGGRDMFILKLAPDGHFTWATKMGGVGYDHAATMALDSSGHLYLAGHFSGLVDFDPNLGGDLLASKGNVDIFVLKLSVPNNTSISPSSPSSLTLSPNPSQGLVRLELPANARHAQVQVLDPLGRYIAQYTLTSTQNELNLSHLPTGIYHISMTLSSGEQYIGKLLLE